MSDSPSALEFTVDRERRIVKDVVPYAGPPHAPKADRSRTEFFVSSKTGGRYRVSVSRIGTVTVHRRAAIHWSCMRSPGLTTSLFHAVAMMATAEAPAALEEAPITISREGWGVADLLVVERARGTATFWDGSTREAHRARRATPALVRPTMESTHWFVAARTGEDRASLGWTTSAPIELHGAGCYVVDWGYEDPKWATIMKKRPREQGLLDSEWPEFDPPSARARQERVQAEWARWCRDRETRGESQDLEAWGRHLSEFEPLRKWEFGAGDDVHTGA